MSKHAGQTTSPRAVLDGLEAAYQAAAAELGLGSRPHDGLLQAADVQQRHALIAATARCYAQHGTDIIACWLPAIDAQTLADEFGCEPEALAGRLAAADWRALAERTLTGGGGFAAELAAALRAVPNLAVAA